MYCPHRASCWPINGADISRVNHRLPSDPNAIAVRAVWLPTGSSACTTPSVVTCAMEAELRSPIHSDPSGATVRCLGNFPGNG